MLKQKLKKKFNKEIIHDNLKNKMIHRTVIFLYTILELA